MLAIETRALTRRFDAGHGVQALDLAVPSDSVLIGQSARLGPWFP